MRPYTAVAGVPRVVGASYMGGSGQWPGAREYTVVRKTSVTHGNVIWDDSTGNRSRQFRMDRCSCRANNQRLGMWEWSKYFTTIGRHGDGNIDETNSNK